MVVGNKMILKTNHSLTYCTLIFELTGDGSNLAVFNGLKKASDITYTYEPSLI